MPPLLAVATMLARRRSPAPLRPRYLQSRPSSITDDMIANLSEAERAEMSKVLAEKDADLDSRLLQQVDAYFQSTNDQGILNRMLTFCGVPKGDRRDKLMWRSTVVATFLGSMVMGHLQARKCNQRHYDHHKHHHEEKSAAAASHSA